MNTIDSDSTPSLARDRKLPLILGSLLAAGFAIRCAIAFGMVNVFHPYEMFQELEQGHRLAFGSGVVPFEFVYGYRSWILPGLIAGIMKLCILFSSAPELYITVLRLLAIAISLTPILCGYLVASKLEGPLWGCLTALVCAIWFQAIYFAPFLMPEVIAAYLTLTAVNLATAKPASDDVRKSVVVGALLGLACCLRFQMAPALLIIAIWYGRTSLRERWLPMTASALAIVLPILGLVDAITLGAPFQSVWYNFHQNIEQRVALDFGSDAPTYYFFVLSPSLHFVFIALFVGWLAVVGAFRAPLLALSALALVVSHSLVAHKEYRFIAFALVAMPVLVGLGLSAIAHLLSGRAGRRVMLIFLAGATAIVLFTSFYEFRVMATYRYPKDTGALESFLAARKYKELCGLGVYDFPWHATGGYTYLHRDVPIYFSYWLTRTPVVDLYGTNAHPQAALATRFDLNQEPLPQYPGQALFANSHAFNFLIARKGRTVSGYRQMRCFPSETPFLSACLFDRPGPCT